MLKYCYRHSDEVRLLLCGSEGSRFSGLIGKMAEIETSATHDCTAAVKTDRKLEHIMGMFQPFLKW